MTTQHAINSVGLCLDIAGAILVWKFGLPESISRTGAAFLQADPVDVAEKRRAERYDLWASFGIGLLVAGFVSQLVSNFL